MKKTILRLLLFVSILFCTSFLLCAESFRVDGVIYEVVSAEDFTCVISSGNATGRYEGDFAISEKIVWKGNTYTVIGIADYTFEKCTKLTSVQIPGTIKTIGELAFGGCTSLKAVSIPNSVESLGKEAFSGCSALKTVKLSENLTEIPEFIFKDCAVLTSIQIPDGVKVIGKNAFENCTMLKDVRLGSSIIRIDDFAFGMCENMLDVDFPETLKFIGMNAFSGCTAIKKVNIPASVDSMDGAFCANISLKSFVVDPENKNYASLDGVLFNKDLTKLIAYPNSRGSFYEIPSSVTEIGHAAFFHCVSLSDIIIPNSVRYIGLQAFYHCTDLIQVVVPEGVEKIDMFAFGVCENLLEIEIGKDVKTIGAQAFIYCIRLEEVSSLNPVPPVNGFGNAFFDETAYGTVRLKVPTGAKEAYAKAEGWKNFTHISEVNFVGNDRSEQNRGVKVFSKDGAVHVSGLSGNSTIEVFDNLGRRVYRGRESRIELPKNRLYIVRVGGKSVKVVL